MSDHVEIALRSMPMVNQGAGDAAASGKEEALRPCKRMKEYEKKLRTSRCISFLRYWRGRASALLVLAQLTWASAVLLGTLGEKLSPFDFAVVSALLILQYLALGLVAFHRSVDRITLPSDEHQARFFTCIIHWILNGDNISLFEVSVTFVIGFIGLHSMDSCVTSPSFYTCRQLHALKAFYILIILHVVLIFGETFIKVILLLSLKSSSAILLLTYNNMQHFDTSWAQPWIDLNSPFKMQSLNYKDGSLPEEVCRIYRDMIWYLYMHERGYEAAEAAMEDTDGYVRQAAANMVGFWAVLEILIPQIGEGANCTRIPLISHTALMSKLADVVADSHGPAGMGATLSIALLLEADAFGNMASEVKSRNGSELLVEILLKRVIQFQQYEPPLALVLQKEGRTYMYALKKLLKEASSASTESAETLKEMNKLTRLLENEPTSSASIDNVHSRLFKLLPDIHDTDLYHSLIKKYMADSSSCLDPSHAKRLLLNLLWVTLCIIASVVYAIVVVLHSTSRVCQGKCHH